MSNVIDLFSRKQTTDTDTEDETETTFAEQIKANKAQKDRLAKDRIKHNKRTFRQYRIQPKGE